MIVPVSFIDHNDSDEVRVCVFCDSQVTPLADSDIYFCCDTYKGIMTVSEWESYTGEKWEEGVLP